MATPTFAVNSGNNLPGITSDWQRVVKRRDNDGTITYQNYAINIWDAPYMDMSEFLILQGLKGQALTSLDTTDIDDRANGATYTSAEIISTVKCEQAGLMATGVRIEIRVDVS